MTRWSLALFLCCLPYWATAQEGVASWYGPGFNGHRTASGARYNMNSPTCAHRSHKFGTLLRVFYKGRSTVCKVTDRGPFVRGRIIDLSRYSARQLGLTLGRVRIEVVK